MSVKAEICNIFSFSIAKRLPEDAYYRMLPSRYVFPGAEIFPEDDEDSDDDESEDEEKNDEDGNWKCFVNLSSKA